MVRIDMKMPNCCCECAFSDDSGDYLYCWALHENRGYTFEWRSERFPNCPLEDCSKEAEKHQAILEQYDMALSLLKALEPVPPIRKKKQGAYQSLYCMCGNCGGWLLDGQKYCDSCGRKVKWE